MDRFRWLEFENGPEPESEDAPEGDARHGGDEPSARRRLETLLEGAETWFLEGEWERALREYARAVEEDRACFEAWAGQVRCQLAMGEPAQARVWAEKAAGLFPESPLVLSVSALVMAWFGDHEQALRTSDAALDLARASVPPVLWLERGMCLLRSGSRDAAETCFARLPDEPDWHQRVGLAWLEADAPEMAARELTAALERRPDRPWLWLLLARAARDLKQTEQALRALDRAVALRPTYQEALEERARLRRKRTVTPWVSSLLGWLGVRP